MQDTLNSIGSLLTVIEGKRHHGSMAEALKKEREKLFKKSKPSKVAKKKDIPKDTTPQAAYFSASAERFRRRYRHSHKTENDLKLTLLFLANEYKVDMEKLMSKSRKSPLVMTRKYFAFFAYYYFMQTQEEISKMLNRERSTIAAQIHDVICDLECYAKSRDIAQKVDKFLHDISDRRKHEI